MKFEPSQYSEKKQWEIWGEGEIFVNREIFVTLLRRNYFLTSL
jgi:hypothetical protein